MVNLPTIEKRSSKYGLILSIIAYTLLALTKCIVGLKANSQAVFADGLNSFTDVLISIAVLIGITVSAHPADKNHTFGHSKAETIATLIAASFMVLMAVNIWLGALTSIGEEKKILPQAMYVSLLSAFIMLIVATLNFLLSKKNNSKAQYAISLDNFADAFVSLGVALGSFGSNLKITWLDSLVATIVGLIILKTGISIGKPAIDALMDGFDQRKLKVIIDKTKEIAGIKEIREIRARNHGPFVFLEITIGVDPKISVKESHALTEKIEENLKGFLNIQHVHVHVEPTNQDFLNNS